MGLILGSNLNTLTTRRSKPKSMPIHIVLFLSMSGKHKYFIIITLNIQNRNKTNTLEYIASTPNIAKKIKYKQHYALQLAAHSTLTFNIYMTKQTYHQYTHTPKLHFSQIRQNAHHTHTPLSYKTYNTRAKETNYIQQLQIHHTHQSTQKCRTFIIYHYIPDHHKDK